jgi:hypothetical protein
MSDTNRRPMSRRKWTRLAGLGYGSIVGLSVCVMFWESGKLTAGLALGVLAISIAVGFGFAALLGEYLAKSHGFFKDE